VNPASTEDQKPHVFHFSPTPGTLGGIWSYSGRIVDSDLKEKYRFTRFSLDEHTHGIEPKIINFLTKKFRESAIDIIHIHDLMLTSWHAVVAARRANVPRILINCHAFSEDLFLQPKLKKLIWREFVEPDILKRADAVYNVSSFGAAKPVIHNSGIKNFGAINVALPVVPASEPSAELKASFGFAPDDIVAATITRADHEKGWQLMADVAERMVREGIDQPKMLFVGDGPHFQEFKERLAPLEKQGRVSLPGRRSDVPEINAMSDFFVSPTFRDYQSSSFLEAMLQNKAVLTTRVGGNAEIVIDGVTGQLIPPGNSDALFDSMMWFTNHPDEIREMGLAGRRRVEQYHSMPGLVANLDRVYQTMLKEFPKPK